MSEQESRGRARKPRKRKGTYLTQSLSDERRKNELNKLIANHAQARSLFGGEPLQGRALMHWVRLKHDIDEHETQASNELARQAGLDEFEKTVLKKETTHGRQSVCEESD